ncbi:glycine cleavage system protein GcvH [Alphaproteobacteria bacterium]|nr:glycine cleavage system protein GcvH [Alphaproteobacteria bacterium]
MSEKKYSKDHEWIETDNDIATIGITNHAQESLGDIVFVELPTIGKQVSSNDEVCVIESVKAASDIYTPIDGEIIEVNEKLNDNGALVNEDPENTAWIFKLKISEPSQFNDLMTLSEYQEFLKTEEK